MKEITLSRTSPLNAIGTEGCFSCVANYGQNILLGTLVFSNDPKVTYFDVNYLDKYVAENTHPSGYMKGEHRKQTKARILISRLIDRSIRPEDYEINKSRIIKN